MPTLKSDFDVALSQFSELKQNKVSGIDKITAELLPNSNIIIKDVRSH